MVRAKMQSKLTVSGPLLCEKAMTMHAQIHAGESVHPFQASKGWLWCFCTRHGIRQLTLQGEKLSSDASALEPFKSELLELMEKESLTLENLYNCDETGLCYKMLPDKTLTVQSETAAKGMKKPKERVTVNGLCKCDWLAQAAFDVCW